jgi:hypothetical protein
MWWSGWCARRSNGSRAARGGERAPPARAGSGGAPESAFRRGDRAGWSLSPEGFGPFGRDRVATPTGWSATPDRVARVRADIPELRAEVCAKRTDVAKRRVRKPYPSAGRDLAASGHRAFPAPSRRVRRIAGAKPARSLCFPHIVLRKPRALFANRRGRGGPSPRQSGARERIQAFVIKPSLQIRCFAGSSSGDSIEHTVVEVYFLWIFCGFKTRLRR